MEIDDRNKDNEDYKRFKKYEDKKKTYDPNRFIECRVCGIEGAEHFSKYIREKSSGSRHMCIKCRKAYNKNYVKDEENVKIKYKNYRNYVVRNRKWKKEHNFIYLIFQIDWTYETGESKKAIGFKTGTSNILTHITRLEQESENSKYKSIHNTYYPKYEYEMLSELEFEDDGDYDVW